MVHRGLAAAVLAALAVVVAAVLAYAPQGGPGEAGVLVVASFPSLADDVRLLACGSDRAASVIPPGADPHAYQLSPSDLDLLRGAALLVVSGHAPFEPRLAEKAEELGVPVLAVDGLEGVRLLRLPTGQVNYHFPAYDPGNYRVFLEALASKLAGANPACADSYRAALGEVEARLDELERLRGALDGYRAVASVPYTQYAVSWLGVEVVELVTPGEGSQASALRLARIDAMLASGEASLAVIAVDPSGNPLTAADRWLSAAAEKNGVPLLRVPAPFLPGSTLEKLELVASQASGLAGG